MLLHGEVACGGAVVYVYVSHLWCGVCVVVVCWCRGVCMCGGVVVYVYVWWWCGVVVWWCGVVWLLLCV